MRFTASVKAVAEALSAVMGVVSTNPRVAILGFVHVEARDGRIAFTANNLGLEARATASAEIEAPGTVCIAARRFHDAVRALAKDADLAGELDEFVFKLRSGRSRFQLPTLPANLYPQMTEFQGETLDVTLAGEALAGAFEAATPYISTDEDSLYLHGALVEGLGASMRVVSTNRHVMFHRDVAGPLSEASPAVIVPSPALREMRRLATAAKGPVKLRVGQRLVAVETETSQLISKTVDAVFPDYRRVFPQHYNGSLVTAADDFEAAVARVRAMASATHKRVEFHAEDDALRLTIKDGDGGEAVTEIRTEAELSSPFTAHFQVQYLADVASSIGGDTLKFSLIDPGAPMLVTGAGGVAIVMPTRG